MKRLAQTLFVILVWPTVCFSQEIEWQSDIDDAMTQAAKTEKLVFLHFTAEWCRPCQNLDKFVFTSSAVKRALADHVIPVKIDVDSNPDLVKKYDVTSVPMDVCVTTTGHVVSKKASPQSSDGYLRMLASFGRVDPAKTSTQLEEHLRGLAANAHNRNGQNLGRNGFVPKAPTHVGPTHEAPTHVATKAQFEQPASNAFFVNARQKPSPSEGSGQFVKNQDLPTVTHSAPMHRVEPTRVMNDRFFARQNQNSAQKTSAESIANESSSERKFERVTNQFVNKSVGISNDVEPQNLTPTIPPQTKRPAEFVQQQEMLEFVAKQKNPVAVPSEARSGTPQQPQGQNQFVASPVENPIVDQLANPAANSFAVATGMDRVATHESLEIGSTSSSNVLKPIGTNSGAVSVGESTEAAAATGPEINTKAGEAESTKIEFALHGKCPVSLLQKGEWVAGNKSFGCIHRGKTFIFANADALATFRRDPDAYCPMLAGFDPVIYHEKGELVDGHEKHGVFMGTMPNQRVLLFSTIDSLLKFQKEPRKYLTTVRQAMEQTDNALSNDNRVVR